MDDLDPITHHSFINQMEFEFIWPIPLSWRQIAWCKELWPSRPSRPKVCQAICRAHRRKLRGSMNMIYQIIETIDRAIVEIQLGNE